MFENLFGRRRRYSSYDPYHNNTNNIYTVVSPTLAHASPGVSVITPTSPITPIILPKYKQRHPSVVVVDQTAVAEQAYTQGRRHGRSEGRAEGHSQGRAEGRAEGFSHGYAVGKAHGEQKGIREGVRVGYAAGREHGRRQGVAAGMEIGAAVGAKAQREHDRERRRHRAIEDSKRHAYYEARFEELDERRARRRYSLPPAHFGSGY